MFELFRTHRISWKIVIIAYKVSKTNKEIQGGVKELQKTAFVREFCLTKNNRFNQNTIQVTKHKLLQHQLDIHDPPSSFSHWFLLRGLSPLSLTTIHLIAQNLDCIPLPIKSVLAQLPPFSDLWDRCDHQTSLLCFLHEGKTLPHSWGCCRNLHQIRNDTITSQLSLNL